MVLKECTLGTPYPGTAGRTFDVFRRARLRLLREKEGTANALLIVQYGTGSAQSGCGCYGSPVETPDLNALAQGSLLPNNVHTAALFAERVLHPDRAQSSLQSHVLYHRSVHGYFCGNGNIPFENGFLSETLLQYDYNAILMLSANRTQHLQTNIGITIS